MNQSEPTHDYRTERHLIIALALLAFCGLALSASSCGQEDIDFSGISDIRATITFEAEPTETPDPNA